MLVLCNNVSFFRKRKNLTEEQLANLIGTTRRTISCIECGKHNPALKLSMLIAITLEVDINQLFYFVNLDSNSLKKDIDELIVGDENEKM